MNKEQVLGVVRHIATAVGGGLILSGKADEMIVQESVGALLSIAAVIWSLWKNSSKSRK